MLTRLSIRDIALIREADITLAPGLVALTGETGAGKSILLQALALALGGRGDAGLVRAGRPSGSVTASFSLREDHPVHTLLRQRGLSPAAGAPLVLQRTLGKNGRSRVRINGQPAGVALLQEAGALLGEILGQGEAYGLLDPASHRAILDAFAGTAELARETGRLRQERERLEADHRRLLAAAATARTGREQLADSVRELETLAPLEAEEDMLAERRVRLRNAEKAGEVLAAAQAVLQGGDEGAPEAALARICRTLAPLAGSGGDSSDNGGGEDGIAACCEALAQARDALRHAAGAVEQALEARQWNDGELDRVESRLFLLRATARKYGCSVPELPALLSRLSNELDRADEDRKLLPAMAGRCQQARQALDESVARLTAARRKGADLMTVRIERELAALRLGDMSFRARVSPPDEVVLDARSNAGATAGPLHRVASGGELSRFALAVKTALAGAGSVPLLVLDEADQGTGGAAAAAVGERLVALSRSSQVLVVTHAPQIAARAQTHLCLDKAPAPDGMTETRIRPLTGAGREEELARMLSGTRITGAARAAAASLIREGAR